jgi:hypothetical protein
MQLFFVLSILSVIFLPLVLCDTIKVNSPTRYQVINNSSFLIDYIIERSGDLFITNTTTELLDVNGDSLVSVPINSTTVRLNIKTFVQPNTVTNFTVKITSFGKYLDGQKFGEIRVEVPLQLNLSNNSIVTLRPTMTSISTPTSTSISTSILTNSTVTSTSILTTVSQPSPNTSSSSGYINGSQITVSLTSFLALFLI